MLETVKRYIRPETDEDCERAARIDARARGAGVIALATAAVMLLQAPEMQEAQDDVMSDIGAVSCSVINRLPSDSELPAMAWMVQDAIDACRTR